MSWKKVQNISFTPTLSGQILITLTGSLFEDHLLSIDWPFWNFAFNFRWRNEIEDNIERNTDSAIHLPINSIYGLWSSQRPSLSVGVNFFKADTFFPKMKKYKLTSIVWKTWKNIILNQTIKRKNIIFSL